MVSLLAEKVMQPASNPECLAFCPTVNLVALASSDEKIHVFRLNGQTVFSLTDRQRDSKVIGLAWKPDGHSLAAAFSSNTLCLASSRTGKVVHRVDYTAFAKSRICCIGWGCNRVDSAYSLDSISSLDSAGDSTRSEQASHRYGKFYSSHMPRKLDLGHVERFLPKLSPLPPGGVEDDIFSSRASLDTIFSSTSPEEEDLVDVLAILFEDGSMHLSIYDMFEIGKFSLQHVFDRVDECCAVMHCFHRNSTSHTLLVRSSIDGTQKLSLVAFDMRLLSQAGLYLSSLASTSSQMRHLLRYIHQVQTQILADFKAAFELPGRFMANVEESLRETGDWTWSQAAYHLIVTGHCPEAVKGWLVDQLGERGHKRWDKAVITGYENIRRFTHEHLLPALERLVVLISRLRGLSKFHVSNRFLGLSTHHLEAMLDGISCMQLLGHQILNICSAELMQFRAFSVWLRQEIDLQASDNSSQDNMEYSAKIDHEKTLHYVKGAMLESKLKAYFGLDQPNLASESISQKADTGLHFDKYKMSTLNNPERIHDQRLPDLNALLRNTEKQCQQLLSGITDVQRRGVRFSSPVTLSYTSSIQVAMRMIARSEAADAAGHFEQFVAIGEASPIKSTQTILIYRIPLTILNGMSAFEPTKCAEIALGTWQLEDLCFLDDQELLIGISNKDESLLVRIEYQTLWYDLTESLDEVAQIRPKRSIDLANEDTIRAHTIEKFPKGVFWTPRKIVTSNSKNTRAACILAKDLFTYRIYDLGTA